MSLRAPHGPVTTRLLSGAIVSLLICVLSGCGPTLESRYGTPQPADHRSVNGTTVLLELFESAGHDVRIKRKLSPRTREQTDVIVWCPSFNDAPGDDVTLAFEDWLLDKPGRTLIYVGPDYDAAVFYWEKMLKSAPRNQKRLIRQELSDAKAMFQMRSASGAFMGPTVPTDDCAWFSIDRQTEQRQVRDLQGEAQWTEGIDPARLEIELNSRIVPAEGSETLLSSQGDVLVSRQAIGESQVIIVANGSFLLNLPLVNHEHRKLADRLIEELDDEQRVVFIDAPGVPAFPEEEPETETRTTLDFLSIWPLNVILLHLGILGILVTAMNFPIFGRPIPEDPGQPSDFGQHVEALGDLLQRTHDTSFAMSRLVHYHQNTRSDSGPLHGGIRTVVPHATSANPDPGEDKATPG